MVFPALKVSPEVVFAESRFCGKVPREWEVNFLFLRLTPSLNQVVSYYSEVNHLSLQRLSHNVEDILTSRFVFNTDSVLIPVFNE